MRCTAGRRARASHHSASRDTESDPATAASGRPRGGCALCSNACTGLLLLHTLFLANATLCDKYARELNGAHSSGRVARVAARRRAAGRHST